MKEANNFQTNITEYIKSISLLSMQVILLSQVSCSLLILRLVGLFPYLYIDSGRCGPDEKFCMRGGREARAIFFMCLEGQCRPPGTDVGHTCCRLSMEQQPNLQLLQSLPDRSQLLGAAYSPHQVVPLNLSLALNLSDFPFFHLCFLGPV